MAIPDFQTMMLPILRAAAEGEVRVSDVVERLAAEFALSPEERSHLLPSGTKTTFSNRVHWAKSHLGKAGLVELTKRGHFRITDQGREVLAASPERIDIKYPNRFPGFQQFREAAEGRESVNIAYAAPPAAGMGYGGSVTNVTKALVGGTGDGAFRAKRYADGNTVGSGPIRDFFGSLDRYKATKGLFVTASTFSPSARQKAEQLSKRIVPIDGDQLTRLMIRHGVGCRIEETLYIKKVDEEFFE